MLLPRVFAFLAKGSIVSTRCTNRYTAPRRIAQLVEHSPDTGAVVGSSPTAPTGG